jgi:flagellar operon protein
MSQDRINNILPLRSTDPITPTKAPTPGTRTQQGDPAGFQNLLRDLQKPGALQFSKHAMARLERRELNPSTEQLDRLSQGADLAASKGSRSAAVLVDDLAFVVAVPARTVVTAIDRSQMREQIFTNIDSAVIA